MTVACGRYLRQRRSLARGRWAGRARQSQCGPGTEFDGDSAVLAAGQWFAIVTPGAGGLARPAARSRRGGRDLAQGVIGPDTAREITAGAADACGVAINRRLIRPERRSAHPALRPGRTC